MELVHFTGGTVGRVTADKVINNIPVKLEQAVVVGIDEDGDLYFASSEIDSDTLMLLERAKTQLMRHF